MMKILMEGLQGQHVHLFTDDAVAFYEKIGFERQGVGFSRISGEYLQNKTRSLP